MARPTALRRESLLPRLLVDALESPADDAGVIDEDPQVVALLLAHVLSHSELDTARSSQFALPELRRALCERTALADLAPLDEQMARLAFA